MKKRKNDVQKGYGDAIIYPVVEQFLLFTVAGMVFDGGMLGIYVAIGAAAFWTSVIMLVLRNPGVPKKWDMIYIRVGLLVVTVLGGLAATYLWELWGSERLGYPDWMYDLWLACV